MRAWEFFGKGVQNAITKETSAQSLIRAQGRNMWRAARKAPKVLGAIAIVSAIQSSLKAADIAQDYAHDIGTAYADLDAVNMALVIHEGTGNYYMGYLALDILLQP